MIYVVVLCNSKITAEPLYNTPCSLDHMPLPTIRRICMKALARYQVILLGEQRHIWCEQLAQGCCRIMPRSESNTRPLDHESNALPLHYRVTKKGKSTLLIIEVDGALII